MLVCVIVGWMFVSSVNASCGGVTCTYTCWASINPAADRFAACTGTDHAPSVPLVGGFMQEDCGGCAQSTDRVKGYWPDASDNSWCWVAASDLSGPSACSPDAIKRAHLSSQGLLPSQIRQSKEGRQCRTSGCWTPTNESMVRGDAGNNGCECHHFLAWMFNGQHLQIQGACDPDCYWSYGYAYGEVNESASIIASEMEYTGSSC